MPMRDHPSRSRAPTALTASGRRTLRRRMGDLAEGVVAGQLTALGWTVLAAGVHVGRDELDLIAVEPGFPPTLVFVEVRSRSSTRFGAPEETLDAAKLGRTYRAVFALLRERRLPDGQPLPPLRWRVDLVAVDGRPLRPEDVGEIELRHVRGIAPD